LGMADVFTALYFHILKHDPKKPDWPDRDRVVLSNGHICPVLLGSAENGNGILRLLKALRHEAPTVAATAARLGVDKAPSCIQVLKTFHTAHGGKLSLVRVLTGELADGATLHGGEDDERASGLFTLMGQEPTKGGGGAPGDTVAIGRLESVKTGDTLSTEKGASVKIAVPPPPRPVYGKTIAAKERKDEVKLTSALGRIIEEDPSIAIEHSQDLGEMVLWGQGEMHLRVALERLARKYGIAAETHARHIPYKETIRRAAEVRGRHKKQSGGHGQFADVTIEIRPLPRGSGFVFQSRIVGGAVPKQWVPAVEQGVRDGLEKGPLGFPVTDLEVTLTDGQTHSVDSSEMAFRIAGRLAIEEGLKACGSILLEPIEKLTVYSPSPSASNVTSALTARRGQILGLAPREDWRGWERIDAYLPQSERQHLIAELRGLTQGLGAFEADFDHMSELTGRLAEEASQQARQATPA